jgi:hypothetical protein
LIRVANGVGLSDEAAKEIAEDDGLLDPEGLTEPCYIVAPVGQRPQRWVAMVAAATAAMIEHDELGDIGEWCKGRLEHGMIEPRPTIQQHHSWRSRIRSPFGASFSPTTSKNNRTPLTIACIVRPPVISTTHNSYKSGKQFGTPH